jgi:hypothetical protein
VTTSFSPVAAFLFTAASFSFVSCPSLLHLTGTLDLGQHSRLEKMICTTVVGSSVWPWATARRRLLAR